MKKKIVKPLPQKEVKKKQNEVMAWILAVMMILWTVASVLGVIGFARTCNIEEESGGIVLASAETAVDNSTADMPFKNRPKFNAYNSTDNSYSFALNYLNTLVWYEDEGSTYTYSPCNFIFSSLGNSRSIRYNGYDETVIISLNGVPQNYSVPTYDLSILDNVDVGYVDEDIWNVYCIVGDYNGLSSTMLSSFPSSNDYYPYNASISIDTHLNGITLIIGIQEMSTAGNIFSYSIVIETTFVQGLIATLQPFYYLTLNNFVEYIRIDGLDFSYAGNNSFSLGYAEGENDGYDRGYSYGYDIGKADGFSQGVADANEYSFGSFFGAIFDVPVQTFLSITNFEILGVNIGGFLLALLTILMILAVLKLIF